VSGHIHTADTLGLHALGDKLAGGETITYALAHRGGSGSLAIIAARLAGPGGTDSQTDGRIAASLNAPLRRGGIISKRCSLNLRLASNDNHNYELFAAL